MDKYDPATATERELTRAAKRVFDVLVKQGMTPDNAWMRVTNLIDRELVGPVMELEKRD